MKDQSLFRRNSPREATGMITYLALNENFNTMNEWAPGCWVNADCPTAEELDFLVRQFQVPVQFINDISDADERPRMEMDDDWQMIIIRIPCQVADRSVPYMTVPLGIILSGQVLITICHFKTDLLNDFINHKKRKNISIGSFYDFFLRMHISTSVWYLKHLKQINNQIRVAENELDKSVKNKELQNLLKIEKSLVFFVTSMKGNTILLAKVKMSPLGKGSRGDDLIAELLEDAETEIQQALEMANIYSDILSGMMDAYASIISNNLNAIMKRLTSISIILMIPTLIASLYGMNIPNGLERNSSGFVAVLIGSFILSFLGVYFFKKRNWF